MNNTNPLDVQCFAKRDYESVFKGDNFPRLLYISRVYPEASDYPRIMHAHDDFVEIILIVSGSSEYLIHNKKQIIQKGDLIIYNSGVVHDEITGPDNRVGSYCVAVGGLHMPGLRENALTSDGAGYIFKTNGAYEELHTIMKIMFENLRNDVPYAEEYSNSLLHALLIKALAITGSRELLPDRHDEDENTLGYRVKEYIDAHYMEPITLQDIGSALNVSVYYLAHIFKEMSGYSPVQYLLKRRIGEAQTLLVTTEYSILRISEMVGYETQSYFSLQFTKHVGMSPNQFRQKYIVKHK